MALTPRSRRILIILAIVGGLGIATCLVCGTLGAFQSSRWFGEMAQQAQHTIAEADAYASAHDDTACLDEGLHRSDACEPTSISCFTQVTVFLDRCLAAAHATTELCDGVPALTDLSRSAAWARETCGRLGRERDPQCPQLVQSVQRACMQRAPH